MNYLERLLDLYVLHPTTAIEERRGELLLQHLQAADFEILIRDPDYTSAFRRVSKWAHWLDALLGRVADPDEQVVECLEHLRRLIDGAEPDFHIAKRLVEGRLRDRAWSVRQRSRYDAKAVVLTWRDYFLSYTNRDATATNYRFRRLIDSAVGKPHGDEARRNQVARILSRQLDRYHHLRGAYDAETLKVGEDVEHEVDRHCRSAFVFVQLVEPMTFDPDWTRRNWCHHEYTTFTEWMNEPPGSSAFPERCIFVLVEPDPEDVLPSAPPARFEEWVGAIRRRLAVKLSSKDDNDAVRRHVRPLAEQIRAQRARVVQSWLRAD